MRGKNRDTLFKEWYESDGKVMAPIISARIQHHKDPKKQLRDLMEFGFIWGWHSRTERDRKVKRKKP